MPSGAVQTLLESTATTAPTRDALHVRLADAAASLSYAPQFLSAQEWNILLALCEALSPTAAVPASYPAMEIDKELTCGGGNGWRYDALPPDGEAWRIFLRGLEQFSTEIFAQRFSEISVADRSEILEQIRAGAAPNDGAWKDFDAALFLRDVCSEAAEIFYAHPAAWAEIGFAGFADAPGWKNIGMNGEDAQERGGDAPAVPAVVPPKPRPAQHFAGEDEVDVVVVGTGAGGGPVMWRLAAAGLKVVTLEAGVHHTPQEFATDERAQDFLFWKDERLSAGTDALGFGANNSGTGVGGSTLHFTAYTPRAQPDDLRLKTETGRGEDWPISFEELSRYYDEVERIIGVSGPTPYPWGPARAQGYPLSPLPLNSAAELMQRGCDALGIRASAAANAGLSQPYNFPGIGTRGACTNRGFCQAGCSVGAKGSVDQTFIPLALGAGAELRAECFVTGFERHPDGRIKAVIYRQGEEESRQRCKAVFLCAGSVETARMLLLHDLAPANGQVGRNLMAHPALQVWGVFPEKTRPWKGIPGGLISEDYHRAPAGEFLGGYLLQSIGVMPVTYASQLARGERLWGAPLHNWLKDYDRTAGINIIGDCLPSEKNFLELSDEKDGRGFAKPRTHFTAGENEQAITAHAAKTMENIWSAAGAERTWQFQRFAHVIGTCRMGDDPESTVVDDAGKLRGVDNLFISDNSIFPSALSVNPALTIMSIALRIADRLLEKTKHTSS